MMIIYSFLFLSELIYLLNIIAEQSPNSVGPKITYRMERPTSKVIAKLGGDRWKLSLAP
jgi:hypothetical protein